IGAAPRDGRRWRVLALWSGGEPSEAQYHCGPLGRLVDPPPRTTMPKCKSRGANEPPRPAQGPGRDARAAGRPAGSMNADGGEPMSTTAAKPRTRRYLTDEQIASYRRDGYLAVPRLIDGERIAELRRATDRFVERSRSVSRSDILFDLDPRHRAQAPALRRIKNPADHDPLYHWVAFESAIPDVVAELIGPDVRFNHSKLNLKGSHVGAPVEFHQDAAFYPHSNDDVLAVGLLLDDGTADNGALAVLPGSHRGPIHTHFDAQGRFVGGMREADIATLDRSRAVLPDPPARSVPIHHYPLLHP